MDAATAINSNSKGSQKFVWPEEGLTRVPDWVYTSEEIYNLEIERIFRGRTWNYVGLEVEIPNAGDFKRSFVGPISVLVTRDKNGAISVVENRCAHRGAEFCRVHRGNAQTLVCPYHQWTYDLKGNLIGVPFRRGSDKQGGMPPSFKPEDHGLQKLNVTTRNGTIFASFAHDMEPLEEYIGADVLEDYDAMFDGRKLRVIGYYTHSVPANWKMYVENLKDPYHATLLHSYLVTFGLMVAGNRSKMGRDPVGRHGTMASAKPENFEIDQDKKTELRQFQSTMKLNDGRMIKYIKEMNSPWTAAFETIWPTLIVQKELNTLGMRHVVPQGPHKFIILWTLFGYDDDSEEMTKHRLRQANMIGPAGLIGLEDHEVLKWVQSSVKKSGERSGVLEMGAADDAATTTMLTEGAIRSMYKHWREVLEV
jgi:phenylpropionate dioxygenase-like ring-hydroxylating dioxygenase large terminal subunit